MELPIGEFFEFLVRGLQDHLGGFFDATSDTIDVAITILERTLSMDSSTWYSFIVVSLITGLLVYLLCRRNFNTKLAIVAGVLTVLAIGSAETWRRSLIGQTVGPEKAVAISAQLQDFGKVLATSGSGALAEDGTRTVDRLRSRFDSVDTGRTKVSLLGERTYERYEDLLSEIRDEAPDAVNAQADRIHEVMREYNPNRLAWFAWLAITVMLSLLAWVCANRGLALFTFIGMSLIMGMGFWSYTTDTLALVMSATGFALLLGVPLGIAAAANRTVDQILKPILDFMQTMPAFVYLIPAVLLFGLGKVPGAMATLIFAMPPAVRLTSLGIRSVPTEVVEAAQSFGSTPMQLLFKAQLPIALPTILAGLNQTIMLALSMVVIGGMIGAGGLGEVVLTGITQLKIGLGFESGLSVVILAIYLDRLTQALGSYQSKSSKS
jgi:glycine betaine/proline transport system permease protein